MKKQTMQSVIFLAVFGLLFLVVALLFKPFLSIILWAAILFVLLNPLYRRLSGISSALKAGRKPSTARRVSSAAALSILAALLILVPVGFLVYLMVRQTLQITGDVFAYVNSNPDLFAGASLAPIADKVRELTDGAVDLSTLDVKRWVTAFLVENQKSLIALSTGLVRNLGGFVLDFAFIVFTLYFFFTDGPALLDLFKKAIPIRSDYMRFFLDRFRDTTRQLIRGNLLVALIQGIIGFIIFTAFGVKGALLLAALICVCSFIPMVGAGTVWLPVSLSYIFLRSVPGGIALLVISAVGISLLDNFYRPVLVGGPLNIHPLPIFFSIVGGVALFGVNGLVMGPLCLALFFTALDIFRAQYPEGGGGGGAPGNAEGGSPGAAGGRA